MATQYTSILKLALPVTGELSGTWGDVVNNNITSMIEQAIAGLSTINTWTANAHTLTVADGTTSESRCAMLVAATGAGGTALTAAGEIICPAASKLYVLKNGAAYAVTLKTAAGTGVAVPAGDTAFLFCDGTNVNACVTTIVNGHISGNLTVDGNTTLGDANTDTVTVTAQFASDLLPSTDNARDLGSTTKSWRTLYCDTSVLVGNLSLAGNTLSSTDTNGNIVIAPNGTGDVQLDADTVRVGDSNANATITTNGTGDLILNTNAGTNSGSITIEDGVNGNIIIAPNGTGQVQITNAALDLTTIEVSNINAKDGTAAITIADSTGAVGISTAVTMSATTQNIALGTSQTTGMFTVGGTAQTGTQTFDRSTKTHTLNLGTGATESGLTKTVNIGTGGVATSTTVINIGSANGTTTTVSGAFVANGGAVFNENGADVDFRVEGDTDANLIFADASTDRVGIGTNTPASKIHAFTTTDTIAIQVESSSTNGYPLFSIKNSGASGREYVITTGGSATGLPGALLIRDATAEANRLTITSGGQVNIGGNFTSTNNTLQVTGNAAIGYTTAAPTTGLIVAGNVGVGTDSPAQKLDVQGAGTIYASVTNTTSGSGSARLKLFNNGETSDGFALINNAGASGQVNILNYKNSPLAFWTNSTERLHLDSSGNLGLGVTPGSWASGAKAMQVSSLGMVWQQTNGDFNIGYNTVETTANAFVYKLSSIAATRFSASDSFKWYVAPSGTAGNAITFTQAMTLDASGNLLVGPTSATSGVRLDIQGASGANSYVRTTSIGNSTRSGFRAYGKSSAGTDVQGDFIAYGDSPEVGINVITNHPLTFATNNTERARITSGGYFKASNSGTYLDATGTYHELRQSASVDTVFITNTNASPTNMSVITSRYTGASPNNTTTYFLYCSDGGSTVRANIRSNGGLANYQSNNVDLSDIRTKTDINPLGSYWNKIAALEIVTYKYKDQTHDDLNIGVIAQQVEQVAPEFVDPDGFGETPEDGVPLKTIYNKDLTFAAIKALQEAMARIEKLEAEVAALKGV